jgi:hypothetical protein
LAQKKMGARGRRSSAELTLLQRAEEVFVVRGPDPPDHLSDEARMEWREVVNSLPADHFCRGMHPLLEAYCRSAVAARVIDRLIQGLDEREGARQAVFCSEIGNSLCQQDPEADQLAHQ